MKNKHLLILSGSAALVTLVLRLLQYFTVIGSDGYYSHDSILTYALYAVLGITALISCVIFIAGNGKNTPSTVMTHAPALGLLYIAAAAAIMFTSGLSFFASTAAPVALWYMLSALGIASALYFALLGVTVLTGKISPLTRILGLFPPLYAALYIVCEFFDSFSRSHQSQTVLLAVSLCAFALYITSICLTAEGAPATVKRVTAVAVCYPAFGTASGICYIIAAIAGKASFTPMSVAFAAVQTVFVLLALLTLVRMGYKADEPQTEKADEQSSDIMQALEKYMSDIPDEENTNE